MSLRQDIIAAVIATPGLQTRQLCEAMGLPLDMIPAISAHLSQLCFVKKIRNERCPPGKGRTYWPTPLSTVDLRSLSKNPGSKRAKREAKVVAGLLPAVPKPRPPRTTYTSQKATKPGATSQITVTRPPKTPPRAAAHAGDDTVEKFLKRGGVIQKLHPHASSNPLMCVSPTTPPNRQGRIQRRREGAI